MPKSNKLKLHVEDYAKIAINEAEMAKSSGTFGVGGLLIDRKGIIYKSLGNKVIKKNNSVYDPTAHVEMQLVGWYYSSKKCLPPVNDMTIIVSLDPCVMCSGAILAGGFSVIYISQDSQAGISCRGFDFPTLAPELKQKAMKTFSAIGVTGKRPFKGPSNSIFHNREIDSEIDQRSIYAFSSSLEHVKSIIHKHHTSSLDELINPKRFAKLKPSSEIAKLLKKYNSKAFSEEYSVNFDKPGSRLGQILIQKAMESQKTTGIFNSACLLDPFGNVLLVEGSDCDNASPTETALLNLLRKYHWLMFEAGSEGSKYFAHIKFCKTILLLGPGKDPRGLMEVGGFCASIEGKLPKCEGSQLQYIIPRQDYDDLQNMLDNLPPLYSHTMKIGEAISEVRDTMLQEFCANKISEYSEVV